MRKLLTTIWYFVWRLLLVLVVSLLLYVLIAWICSYIPSNANAPKVPKNASQTLYIHSNGVHTDIIFPLAAVPENLLAQLEPMPNTQYLGIGWGDKGFYLDTPTWAELKASTAVRAMLLTSPTAMHVTHYPGVGRDWHALPVNDRQLAQLHDYLWRSFRTTQPRTVELIPNASYGNNDRFYEANGSYNGLQTCNEWVNDILKEMGIRTAIWSPFDWGILRFRV